jgi:hypothetical protein
MPGATKGTTLLVKESFKTVLVMYANLTGSEEGVVALILEISVPGKTFDLTNLFHPLKLPFCNPSAGHWAMQHTFANKMNMLRICLTETYNLKQDYLFTSKFLLI